jgi:transcriptional regulator with XRE-family HTH domain
MSFGAYVNDLRIKSKKTLRQFCLENNQDPSNWSKVERDVNPPPKDEAVLRQWAKYFGLKPKTEEWNRFMDAARISRGEIPKDILDDEKAVALLPTFFRTVRGAEIGEAEIKKLIQKIKDANTPDER